MHIQSSAVSMGSQRSYCSITQQKTAFSVSAKDTALLYHQSASPDYFFSDLWNQDAQKEQARALKEAQSRLSSFQSSSMRKAELEDARKRLQEIRQQCLDFLIQIFFPEKGSGHTGEDKSTSSKEASSPADTVLSGQVLRTQTLTFHRSYYREETERTGFQTTGTVKCSDGRELNFNLNLEMSRSFQEYYEENFTAVRTTLCDPLVINLEGSIPSLSDQTFYFDLDCDGQADEISRLSAGSGFLALDRNGDGVINDGSELFGAGSGNGFADLSAYDEDHNGFIDEGDAVFHKLKIWTIDENGQPQLYSLSEKGIGAICLQNVPTDFSLKNHTGEVNGVIRRTGIFLYENGMTGTVQHLDMTLHNRKEPEGLYA